MVRSINIPLSIILQSVFMTAPGGLQIAGAAVIFVTILLARVETEHVKTVFTRCFRRGNEAGVGSGEVDADVERAGEAEGMLAAERERKLSAGTESSGGTSESSGFASGSQSAASASPSAASV